MAARRRFEASFEIIIRDLRSTCGRMGPTAVTIELGGTLSQVFTRQVQRLGWALATQQPGLFPSGAAVAFQRDGRRYRFACTNYLHPLDNLRAAQRAVSLLYTIYDEYAVNEGQGAGDAGAFDRLFGGHLALGDGGDAPWWQVLGVSPAAPPPVIKAAYLALVKVHHPDNQTGDQATFVRVQRAYDAAMALTAR
jgi:hypothetical protein